jgi:hypothetical protein
MILILKSVENDEASHRVFSLCYFLSFRHEYSPQQFLLTQISSVCVLINQVYLKTGAKIILFYILIFMYKDIRIQE